MRWWRRLGMAVLMLAGATASAQHLDPLAPAQAAGRNATAATRVPAPAMLLGREAA